MSPRRQLYQFKRILASIDAINQNELSPRLFSLRLTIDYTLTCLRRTYNLWEDQEYIPETEKVTMADMIKALQTHFIDNKEAIVPFIQFLLNKKQPSAQDNMYQQMLKEVDQPNSSAQANINITIENKLEFNGPVANAIAKVEHLNTENHE